MNYRTPLPELYHEYPAERRWVEETLRGVGPGDAHRMDYDMWRKAFWRLTGPMDATFGPSESPMKVFNREWPDFEFTQVSHGECILSHWHIFETVRDHELIRKPGSEVEEGPWLVPGDEGYRDSNSIFETREVQKQVRIDRRTGRRV